jgi:fructosamine-3-kinase
MMIPQVVRDWIRDQGYGEITYISPVGGGCINQGARLKTDQGDHFFLKTNHHAPGDMFSCEASGLIALHKAGGPRVPQPFIHGPDFLLMEDLAPAVRRADYWPSFGQQLARLHQTVSPHFGFMHNNYIGSTPQPNPWTADGFIFFGEHRLLFQANLAQRAGYLGKTELAWVEKIIARLPNLIPEQPASLLHGDLWGGNAIADDLGAPAMIDPAAHYGWAEAELAMTALFGSFPDAFYTAYQEEHPHAPGLWERFPIYNLYHLLNHLNLFGAGYLGEVMMILRRYGS